MVRQRHYLAPMSLVSLLVFFAGSLPADEKPHAPEAIAGATTVSAEQVVELILSNPELIIIDARKKAEYVKGHIEGAVNILNTELTVDDLQKLTPHRDQALLFYCNGSRCLRSSDAIDKAMRWGYTNIYWFRGGWQEWSEKRLPVITE